uniref:Nitric oxide synthase-interacting protein-like n=1 Tax=Geotrypetes seraphini TaxID=260995 RepID=A0A6P8P5E6_GEOSA|nr:nitric oxide synthase-interacting protein-like [Geotrypetes seraphini]
MQNRNERLEETLAQMTRNMGVMTLVQINLYLFNRSSTDRRQNLGINLHSPDGYIYEKEAILEYILHQKKEITLQLKAYEKQRSELKTEQEELSKAVKESQVKGFLEKEMSIVLKPVNHLTAVPD